MDKITFSGTYRETYAKYRYYKTRGYELVQTLSLSDGTVVYVMERPDPRTPDWKKNMYMMA